MTGMIQQGWITDAPRETGEDRPIVRQVNTVIHPWGRRGDPIITGEGRRIAPQESTAMHQWGRKGARSTAGEYLQTGSSAIHPWWLMIGMLATIGGGPGTALRVSEQTRQMIPTRPVPGDQ